MIKYNDYDLSCEDEDGNKYILIANEIQPSNFNHQCFIYKKVEKNND